MVTAGCRLLALSLHWMRVGQRVLGFLVVGACPPPGYRAGTYCSPGATVSPPPRAGAWWGGSLEPRAGPGTEGCAPHCGASKAGQKVVRDCIQRSLMRKVPGVHAQE